MNQRAPTFQDPAARTGAAWLNQNVVGMGLSSLFSDAGYEMATAILPGFLAVLGVSAAALGAIEGIADSISSFVKLGSGWLADRLGHRKAMAVGGYFLTGIAKGQFAFAHGWPLVLVGRVSGWLGKGIRGPARDTLLADSVPAEARGKAFGFHRSGDTLGAIIGPLLGVALLTHFDTRTTDPALPFRIVFLVTIIPGLASGIAFATLVRETKRRPSQVKFQTALANLPPRFRRFLWAAGVFGIGDFARTLMILAATQLLTPRMGIERAAELGGLLYVGHNVFYAASSFPVGALSDRLGRRGLLARGYFAGAFSSFGFLAAFRWGLGSLTSLLLLFALAGFSIAVVDALEGALTADLVHDDLRNTA